MNRILFAAGLAVLLSACSSDGEERPAYLDSQSLEALEVPPQLTRPNNTEELQIPQPSARALASLQKAGEVSGLVAPAFKGVVVKSGEGLNWLELQTDADNLWPLLRDFWASEGIDLDRDEPLLGLMETEWVKEYQVKADRDAGFLKRVLSAFSPDVVDRFRMRVERDGQLARIYVSHRRLAIAVTGETSRWVLHEPDPALEKEILYRLSLFAGLTQQQADALFLAYIPYQSRVKMVSDNSFEITGRSALAWRRLQHALDQLGASVLERDEAQGRIRIEMTEIPQALLAEAEGDEVYDPLSEVPMNQPVTATAREASDTISLVIALSGRDGNTLLEVTDGQGRPVTDGLGYDVVQMLARLLK